MATIEATPTAMQTKKNRSRCQDALISRNAIRMTKSSGGLRTGRHDSRVSFCGTGRPSRRTSRVSASDASSASCVEHERGRTRSSDVEQQIHDVAPGGRIEVSRRLVGQHDRRIVGERARNRNALLLSRQLRRIVVRAIGQPDLLHELPRACGRIAPTRNLHRDQHVLEPVSDGTR